MEGQYENIYEDDYQNEEYGEEYQQIDLDDLDESKPPVRHGKAFADKIGNSSDVRVEEEYA